MRKKMFHWILCAMMVFMLGACGEKQPVSEQGQESQTVESTETASQGSEASSNPVEEVKKMTSMELFEGFLAGEVKLHKGSEDYGVYDYLSDAVEPFFVPFVDDGGYTLKGFIGRVQDLERKHDDSVYVYTVNYSYLDLGNDGEPEMLLQICHSGNGEPTDYSFIIRNVDGELQVGYMLEASYNNYSGLINKYGLMYEGYYYEGDYSRYGYLDGDCKFHLLYWVCSYYALGVYNDYEKLGVLAAANRIANEDGNGDCFDGITLFEYYIGEDRDYDEMEKDAFFSYDTYLMDEEGNYYYEDGQEELVKKALSDASAKYVPMDEVEGKLEAYAKQLGVQYVWNYEDDVWLDYIELSREEYWPGKIVTVSDVDGFLKEVADDTIIYLEPGTYNLSQWLLVGNRLQKTPYFSWDNEESNRSGVIYHGYDTQDYEIVFSKLHNFMIASADPKNPAKIVCEAPYARVINFYNCNNVSVENLIFGHEVEHGVCSGDVLGIEDSNNMAVNGCDLYGCGAYGLGILRSYNVTVSDSKIHDCTYGCMTVTNSGWVGVYDTSFVDCEEYTMFSVYEGSIGFNGCTFRNLRGNMVSVSSDWGFVSFSDCVFDKEALESIKSNSDFGDKINIY